MDKCPELNIPKINPEWEPAIEQASKQVTDACVQQMNYVRLELLKQIPSLQTEDGQFYLNLNLPYDSIVQLIKSMMAGRSYEERKILVEMIESDMDCMVTEPIKLVQQKYQVSLNDLQEVIQEQIKKTLENNPHWEDGEKYLFIVSLISQLSKDFIIQTEGRLDWADFEKFLGTLQHCFVDKLTCGSCDGTSEKSEINA